LSIYEGKSLRTRIYLDGYNFYYGCLKRTEYKWLDPIALFLQIVQTSQSDLFDFVVPTVKYFTSPILAKFAKAADSISRQTQYHHALQGYLGESIQIVQGYYSAERARAYLYEKGKAPIASELKEVWKLVEKQTDVALALSAYSDAVRNEVDQVVFVTNDTDVVPALDFIRRDTKVKIGLVVPTRYLERTVNTDLAQRVDWVRSHIPDFELAAAQLPSMIKVAGNAIHKPLSWYPRPDLLMPIYEEAKRVKRSHGAALKWLNTPCKQLGERLPIFMARNDVEAKELLGYMLKYAKDFGLLA
jgi:6-hydroxy-3-succinoylpyridine 3-monooxygenase